MQMPMIVLTFGESPRWHDDRLWFSDWGAQTVATVEEWLTRHEGAGC